MFTGGQAAYAAINRLYVFDRPILFGALVEIRMACVGTVVSILRATRDFAAAVG